MSFLNLCSITSKSKLARYECRLQQFIFATLLHIDYTYDNMVSAIDIIMPRRASCIRTGTKPEKLLTT